MGYTVEYSPQQRKKYPPKKDLKALIRKYAYTALTLAAALALILLHRRGILREVLIPGDADVTQAAAEKMMESLRQGDSLHQSLRVFCRDILMNGQVY